MWMVGGQFSSTTGRTSSLHVVRVGIWRASGPAEMAPEDHEEFTVPYAEDLA